MIRPRPQWFIPGASHRDSAEALILRLRRESPGLSRGPPSVSTASHRDSAEAFPDRLRRESPGLSQAPPCPSPPRVTGTQPSPWSSRPGASHRDSTKPLVLSSRRKSPRLNQAPGPLVLARVTGTQPSPSLSVSAASHRDSAKPLPVRLRRDRRPDGPTPARPGVGQGSGLEVRLPDRLGDERGFSPRIRSGPRPPTSLPWASLSNRLYPGCTGHPLWATASDCPATAR